GLSVSGSIGPRVRAACSHSTGWPAPVSNAILKSGAKPTPTTHNTPNTSRSAAVLLGAYAGEAGPPHWPLPPLEYPIVFRPSLGCRRVPAQGRTGWSDLSRMKGNFQVRFLEGGGLATARLYSARPVREQSSIRLRPDPHKHGVTRWPAANRFVCAEQKSVGLDCQRKPIRSGHIRLVFGNHAPGVRPGGPQNDVGADDHA